MTYKIIAICRWL